MLQASKIKLSKEAQVVADVDVVVVVVVVVIIVVVVVEWISLIIV